MQRLWGSLRDGEWRAAGDLGDLARYVGRWAMRHIFVAASMLMFALLATFSAASVLQFSAIAHANKSAEPFVIEAAKPLAKPASERSVSSMFRSRDTAHIVRVSG